MARSRLGQAQQGPVAGPQQGYAAGPQQGWAAEPQAGPVPGYAGQPQAGPVPGYPAQPQAGSVPGGWPGRTTGPGGDLDSDGLEQAVADIAMGAAARFLGRAVSRRVQKAVNERVLPALAARGETMLHEQIAIAERHPDLRACMADKVIFLAGGGRVLPMASITGRLTLEQSDALVAQLREG